MRAELVEEIENIPMLPETIQKLEAVCQNPQATTNEMVKAIESDPLLIARILKQANSPMYGLSRTVTDIAHAISLLGRDMVRTFAIAAAANDMIKIDLAPYGLTLDNYLKRAQTQHALASQWAAKVDRKNLTYVSLASYLMELGRVVISQYLRKSGQGDAFQGMVQSGKELKKIEVDFCGAKSEDVTATIFNHWKFEPDLIYVIRYSNEPEDVADEGLQLASKLLKVSKEAVAADGSITDETIAHAKALLEEYELEAAVFDAVAEKVRFAA